MITGSFPNAPCGVGDYTYRLANGLAKPGINIAVITTDDAAITASENNAISVFKLIKNWRLYNIFKIIHCIKKIQPDCIHIQYPTRGYKWFLLPNMLPLFCRWFFPKIQRIVTIHEFSIAHPLRKMGMIFLLLFSDKIIFPDQREAESVLKWLPIIKTKYTIIPIGANIEPSLHKKMAEKPQDIPYIVYFGFATKSKGIDTLLHALKQLRPFAISCKLVMITQLSYPLQEMINKLNLEHEIVVTGHCFPEQISHYFQNAFACVLPFNDGISLRRSTFLTAICHNVPVITTKGKDVPSCLKNWENVILTEIGNSGEIADTIVKLIQNPELREKISNNTKELAKYFSWDAICKKHVELYSSIIT
ncbi:MAG: glycosyltransferase family 4 protein [Candidatus Kuenenia sp.]|nr:glycosyltransferase family 4 protein [Candidatus Kuenenia hertensis]